MLHVRSQIQKMQVRTAQVCSSSTEISQTAGNGQCGYNLIADRLLSGSTATTMHRYRQHIGTWSAADWLTVSSAKAWSRVDGDINPMSVWAYHGNQERPGRSTGRLPEMSSATVGLRPFI